MKRNKYLDNLKIPIQNYGNNFVKEKKIQRFLERRKYGFDFRETIHMDIIFAEWLYSRLRMLMEQTHVDLEAKHIEFDGVRYTIGEAFEKIKTCTAEYLLFYEKYEMEGGGTQEQEEAVRESMDYATRLWAEVMPYADRIVISN